MQSSNAASRPVPHAESAFRDALAAVSAKERAVRARRPDRIEAVASLQDRDLVRLALEFDRLLHGPADASTMTARLHAALQSLSPETPTREDDDA